MLYKKNQTPKLDEELFQNPTNEYRGAPFWSWNCDLEQGRLNRQIGYLKEMGFGGFLMHSRTGMTVEYLSDRFMDRIKGCVEKAEQEGMLAWLYDEDRWPSGAAGGLVTRNPAYAQKALLFTVTPQEGAAELTVGARTGAPVLLAVFDVTLHTDGALADYRQIEPEETPRGAKWYAYMVTSPPVPWHNGHPEIDILNPAAVKEFLRVTHERFLAVLGQERFGGSVPAVFTDEPQHVYKQFLVHPQDTTDVRLPWTPDLPESFRKAYGDELVPHLPELIWELPEGRASQTRYRYHNHVTDRFVDAFAAQYGEWCQAHGLALCGHLLDEWCLGSQTSAVGEAMRFYPHFQIPGMDLLCDNLEFVTARQVQSVVRQQGREAMASELYGVTNWDFDFRGHKFQGDWQAAMGVTVRVPHLSWVSMRGRAKRDYPASINYQSPWYKEYRYIEDHFARLNTALTRGTPQVRVAVLHPIESFWLHWGPRSAVTDIREQMEDQLRAVTRWLITGCIDFDFLSEALLPTQCPEGSAPLRVGKMAYDAVVIPPCETLRSSTLKRLKAFQAQGGLLLFMGEAPRYLDAAPSLEPAALWAEARYISFDKVALWRALEGMREVEVFNVSGTRAENLLYQLRRDNDCGWLFLAHAEPCANKDIAREEVQRIRLRIRGCWRPELYDTLRGGHRPIPYGLEKGDTVIETDLYAYDSLLLRLEPTAEAAGWARPQPVREKLWETVMKGRMDYTRAEPNVLLLDTAEYALDGEPFHPEEEILRLDNLCRERLGWPARILTGVQPWALEPEEITHTLTLRFAIQSRIPVEKALLAVEDVDSLYLELNGEPVPARANGWYVDEDIQTVPLPGLNPGRNTLIIRMPFGRSTNTEWCYLLGEFSAAVEGAEKWIDGPPAPGIPFGDITRSGMPFYGGSLTYHTQAELPAGDLVIHAGLYRGALIRVAVDGVDRGAIVLPPYDLTVENIEAGTHRIDFTLFGTRYNSFAALHDAEDGIWAGPPLWYTQGDRWTDCYRLRETGILSPPVLTVYRRR